MFRKSFSPYMVCAITQAEIMRRMLFWRQYSGPTEIDRKLIGVWYGFVVNEAIANIYIIHQNNITQNNIDQGGNES